MFKQKSTIQSILDNDLYKFTQQQAVLHNYPKTEVKYKFYCRNGTALPAQPDESIKRGDIQERAFLDMIDGELYKLCDLRLTSDEKDYMDSTGLFTKDYLDYLEGYSFKRDYISVSTISEKNSEVRLNITIKGNWTSTILFEVPILAMVNEAFYKVAYKDDYDVLVQEGKERLEKKLMFLEINPFKLIEFGTRRRFNFDLQELAVRRLIEKPKYAATFVGTSNVYLAKEYNCKPIGTMAHEWIQAHQQLVPLQDSQRIALEVWQKEYKNLLGIALTDTLGTQKFIDDFNVRLAKTYAGVRQDSGDPFVFGKRMIKAYQDMGINPKEKSIIFSDSLNFGKARMIDQHFKDETNCSFGIGTYITNDTGISPLNIVIKMVECNGMPIAKLSDAEGKETCENKEYLNYLKSVIRR